MKKTVVSRLERSARAVTREGVDRGSFGQGGGVSGSRVKCGLCSFSFKKEVAVVVSLEQFRRGFGSLGFEVVWS